MLIKTNQILRIAWIMNLVKYLLGYWITILTLTWKKGKQDLFFMDPLRNCQNISAVFLSTTLHSILLKSMNNLVSHSMRHLLWTQINKVYKRLSTRLKLQNRIRENVPHQVSITIFQSMIEPILLYCCTIYWNLSPFQTQKNALFEKEIQNIWLDVSCVQDDCLSKDCIWKPTYLVQNFMFFPTVVEKSLGKA